MSPYHYSRWIQITHHNVQPAELSDSGINCILHVFLFPYISPDSYSLNFRIPLLDKSRASLGTFEVDVD